MIKRITLKNFRIFQEKTVEFQPGVNVILGKNGVGKTSLLEAIYFLSFTKSFKAPLDSDMVKHNKDYFQISSLWDNEKHKIAQGNYWKKKGKKFIFDDEGITRLSDIIGTFPIVFQSPEDYRVTAGPSAERRIYFDRFISQISKEYLQDLITYRKLIKTRNSYLKQLNENNNYSYTPQLQVYDKQLSPVMFRIINMRRSYVSIFNDHLKDLYNNTFNGKTQAAIKYKPSLMADNEIDFQTQHSKSTQESFEKEIVLKRTLYGPNYDKYVFLRNNTPLIHFASQGEHKIWMTMMKLAEGEIIKDIKKKAPLFLLDDLFAELDLNNSRRIIERIKNAGQVLITTTDMSDIRNHGMDVEKDNINIIDIS